MSHGLLFCHSGLEDQPCTTMGLDAAMASRGDGQVIPLPFGDGGGLSHSHLGMVVGYPTARTLQDGTAEILLWEAGAAGENPGQHPQSLDWK